MRSVDRTKRLNMETSRMAGTRPLVDQVRLAARIEWHEDALAHLWTAYDRAAAAEEIAAMLSLSDAITRTVRSRAALSEH